MGDVHGQYFDLLNILKKWRPDHSLLFLGDYVGESNIGKMTRFTVTCVGESTLECDDEPVSRLQIVTLVGTWGCRS